VITGWSRASRRLFLGLAGTAALGGTAVACGRDIRSLDPPSPDPVPPAGPVPATGAHQAGVATPDPPQPHLRLAVFDVDTDPAPLLAGLGEAVRALTSAAAPDGLAGLAPGDLTCTIGVGPRLVGAVDPGLPGARPLPGYRREAIESGAAGGDLMVQCCASDPLLPGLAVTALAAATGPGLVPRWAQDAVRGPAVPVGGDGATAARNLLGFADGIVVPRNPPAYDRDVWLAGPAPVAGGTIAVVRRMWIDVAGFGALPVDRQEAVIGRTRADSVPLSGGAPGADVDLNAKSPDGRYLIPADAHVRRAHPLAAGVATMARRSYSITGPEPGLLFISFQRELRTFTATMARMEGADALLAYTTTTATGTFLVLPGFDAERPLGSTLFGAR
jgi:dye decolorizing peroxidase